MTVLNINPLAVIVATIVPMLLGFLWYGPLFGNTWMAARGITREQMGNVNAGQAYGLTTVLALVTAIAMAMVVSAASAQNLIAGVTLGAIVGIGLVATALATNGIFEERSWTLVGLNAGYQIVSLILMGAVIGAWR
jgi:hypothetical protein